MTAVRLLPLLLLALLPGVPPGFAQQADGSQSQQPAPEAAPEPAPNPSPESNRTLEFNREPQQGLAPPGIRGIVKRADNRALDQAATVVVVCQEQVLAVAETRNRFELSLPRLQALGRAAQPDTAGGVSGCEVRVRLTGFRPATVRLASLAPGGQDIGWVTLYPLADGSRYAETATTALAPKEARKAWEKGRSLLAENKLKGAAEALREATSLYPRFAAAWCDLGTVYQEQGEDEEARKAYAAAIEADRQYVPPYMQMATLAAAHRAWPVVEGVTAEVIRRNPYEYPQAFLYHAAASYNLGKLEAAESSVRRAIEMDETGRLPRAYLLLARILIETNRRADAEQPLARYLELTEGKPEAEEGRALMNPGSSKPAPFRIQGEAE